jgi:hypothetical protein
MIDRSNRGSMQARSSAAVVIEEKTEDVGKVGLASCFLGTTPCACVHAATQKRATSGEVTQVCLKKAVELDSMHEEFNLVFLGRGWRLHQEPAVEWGGGMIDEMFVGSRW